jgi:hypothetical protein
MSAQPSTYKRGKAQKMAIVIIVIILIPRIVPTVVEETGIVHRKQLEYNEIQNERSPGKR